MTPDQDVEILRDMTITTVNRRFYDILTSNFKPFDIRIGEDVTYQFDHDAEVAMFCMHLHKHWCVTSQLCGLGIDELTEIISQNPITFESLQSLAD